MDISIDAAGQDLAENIRRLTTYERDTESDGSSDSGSSYFSSDCLKEALEDLCVDTTCLLDLEPLLSNPIKLLDTDPDPVRPDRSVKFGEKTTSHFQKGHHSRVDLAVRRSGRIQDRLGVKKPQILTPDAQPEFSIQEISPHYSNDLKNQEGAAVRRSSRIKGRLEVEKKAQAKTRSTAAAESSTAQEQPAPPRLAPPALQSQRKPQSVSSNKKPLRSSTASDLGEPAQRARPSNPAQRAGTGRSSPVPARRKHVKLLHYMWTCVSSHTTQIRHPIY